MTQLDAETKAWLHSLKLNKTFSSIAEFENGYNFGTIFDKLQLTRGKKFKDSSDLGCIFQNYKNVRDLLLENFNYDFPVNNIIYRTADLLKVMREQTIKYLQQKKVMAMKAVTTSSIMADKSYIQPIEQKHFKNRQKQITNSATMFNQTSKMPKKIQDIQKKLDKFREQKTRHQLIALQQRKQQIDQYRKLMMSNREFQISKIKKLHDSTKQKQKKVYDVWYKTQQIKKQRIQTDKNFQNFQKSKKQKLLQSLRQQELDFINKGQQMFELNCMRQGIQLQHDPDRPPKPEGQFNKIVVLQRIKDNISKNQIDKKQRLKRQNKKRIDAEQAKIRSQILWSQLNKIDDYSKKFSSHFELCEKTYKVQKRMQAEQQTRKQKCKNKVFVDLPAFLDQQKRQQQYRKRKIQYLFNDAEWVQKKYKKNYSIAEEVVQALLQATIEGEDTFQKNQGFYYSQWKALQNKFLNFQDVRKRKNKDTKLYMDYSAFNNMLKQYLKFEGSWKNFHQKLASVQQPQNQNFINYISNLISTVHPDKEIPNNQKAPLYMPLKIILNGARLSGKSSLAGKLYQKFGVTIINPKQIIKQSLDLARPPVEQDPKKAAKKDSKKVQEPTPQKIALKQFGVKLLQQFNTVQQAKIQHYIATIKFRLQQLFKQKSDKQVIEEYKTAKQKQKSRHQLALRQFEQAQKKPKKESKKGGGEPVVQQPPKPNLCFYSTGFVVDDYLMSQQSIRTLQRELNCYISQQEKINKQAVNLRKSIALVVQIPEKQKDNRLKQGTFDLFASLNAKQQNLVKRKQGRKIDPQTKIIYHPTYNPAPDIKGFAQKLVQLPTVQQDKIKSSIDNFQDNKNKIEDFYSDFGLESKKISAYSQIDEGEQTYQQTFERISRFVQNLLTAKYQLYEHSIQLMNNSKQQQKQVTQPKQNQVPNQDQKGSQNQQEVQKNIVQLKKETKSEQIFQKYHSVNEVMDNLLSKQDCVFLLQKLILSISKYQQGIKQCLFSLDVQRGNFLKQLLVVQKKFTNIINRPDDKAGKILAFQQNYNKLLSQQGSVVKDVEASKHLVQRLNQLYDSLWDAIGSKKNQAVQQRIKFRDSNWLNTQATKIVQTLKNLLQIQLNYLCQVIFVILLFVCKLQKKSFDYMDQYLSLGIAPNLQPILAIQQDASDIVTNKRLDYYIQQTNKCIGSLDAWVQQKFKKMKIDHIPVVDKFLNQFIRSSVYNISRKQQSIRNKVSQRVLQQRSYYQTLLNKMDDWIIEGIKAENDFVYQIYKNIKKCIEQARKSNVKQLHVKQITDIHYPIKEMTLVAIPLRVHTLHRKLPIYSYMIFLEQIKTITNNEGKINFQLFKKYMNKRKKSQLLDSHILRIDYDIVSQYLVKDNYLYLRQLAMAVLLWDVKVFDDDQLASYKSKLLRKQQTHQQKNYKRKNMISAPNQEPTLENGQNNQLQAQKNPLIKKRLSVISAFPTEHKLKLNDLILMEGAFDQQQQFIIKHFIFQIFRNGDSDYIQTQCLLDTLSFFDQIQVLKYGDTVMLRSI